jgi:hypothetical protein
MPCPGNGQRPGGWETHKMWSFYCATIIISYNATHKWRIRLCLLRSIANFWLIGQLLGDLKFIYLFIHSCFIFTTLKNNYYHFFLWPCGQTQVIVSSFMRFLDQAQQGTTVVRTPMDEWSARRRDFYLITHKAYKQRQACTRRDLNQESQHANDCRPTT